MPDPMKIDIKIEKEEASRSIDQLFSKLKSIGEPVKAIKSVLEKLGMDTVFNTANKVITETKDKFGELVGEGVSTSEMFNIVNDRTKLMNEAFEKMGANAEQASEAFTDIGSEVDPLNNALEDLGTEAKKAGDSLDDVGNGLDDMIDPADDVKNKLNELGNKLDDMGEKAEKSKKMFGGFVFGVNQYIEISKKAISILSEPIKKAGQFETLQMSLEVVMGSAEKAKERFKELADFTKGTTFEVGQVVQAGKELQSLGKYSKETLSILSNLAMGSGKSLEEVTKAYTMLVKGKKGQAMELFRDIGITIDDFTKATGKGIDKTTGLINASTKEMMNALGQIVSDRNFEGMIEKQSQTFEGMLGSLKDGWNSLLADFGSAFLPLAKEIMKIISFVFDIVKNNIQYIKTTALVVGGVGAAIGIVVLAIKAWTLATTQLTVAMMANPVLAVTGGVLAVLAVVTLAIAKLSDATEDASKKQLQNTEAELQNLQTRKKTLQATQKEAETNEKLLNEYDRLASKKSNTAKESKRLYEISQKLSGKYSDLVINTNDFRGSLQAVQTKAGEVKGAIAKYKDEIVKLNDTITETQKRVAALKVQEAFEKLQNLKMDAHSGFFSNLFKTDTYEQAKNYFNDYKKAIEKAGKAGGKADVGKALGEAYEGIINKMKNDPAYKVFETDEDLMAEAKKKASASYDSFRHKNYDEYLIKVKKELEKENAEREKIYTEHSAQASEIYILALKKNNIDVAEAEEQIKAVEEDKKAKTEAEKLQDELKWIKQSFEYKKELLDEQKRNEIINREKYNNDILEAEKELQEGLIKIRSGAEAIEKKGMGSSDKQKQEYEKARDLIVNSIQEVQTIQKNKLARDKEYLEGIIGLHKKGEDTIQMYRDLGITNNDEYLKSLEKQLSQMSESVLIELEKRYIAGEKLNDEELNALKSYMEIKKGLFDKISELNVKTTNINMAELVQSLEVKKGDLENGKLVLEDYKNFVINNFDNLLKELNKPEYSNIFEKFQDNSLTQEWLDAEIERLKEFGNQYADSLNPIIEALKKFKEEKKELEGKITADQQYFGDVSMSLMNSFSKGFGEAIAGDFGKEGFKKLQESMFEGFKAILVETLEFIEKKYLLGTAASIIEAILNPVGAIKDAGLLAGAFVSLQTAKVAINSWTPKFATGGAVTGPTYLLAGENNKKEYIIPADIMRTEVRDIFQKEFHKYTPSYYKQTVEVKLEPVEMIQKGRDLHGIIRQQEKLETARVL